MGGGNSEARCLRGARVKDSGMKTHALATLAPLALLTALVCICFAMGDALAQSDYPDKPVRIISDSAVGSANDVTARILADRLGKIWGQQVVIFNQPGAGGGISARAAASAPADGYTLYIAAASVFLALRGGPGVAPNLPAEVPRDFAVIGFVLQEPLFIAASPKTGINSFTQLLAQAKQRPNELSYASTGRGRLTHLAMELLQERADVKLRLVPYAGGPAEAMSDVISDRVDLIIDGYGGLAGAMQGGIIKMLASTWSQRLPSMENLPTVAETLPDYFVAGWGVLLAPVGTPVAVIRKVTADLRTALEDKTLAAKFEADGAFPSYKSPEDTTAFIQSQQKLWRPIQEKIVREAQ
jgi:tripartite-type tricarboxylate transporter receptor subunit TctC